VKVVQVGAVQRGIEQIADRHESGGRLAQVGAAPQEEWQRRGADEQGLIASRVSGSVERVERAGVGEEDGVVADERASGPRTGSS
jgi:hypothetical protein